MKKQFMTLVAVFCYILTPTVFTACSLFDDDNPVIPEPEGPKADNYVFNDEIDNNTVPGDDFYQYVVGKWLAQTAPPEEVGEQGTMGTQAQQGYQWLNSVLTDNSPDPVIAELFKRLKTAQADREGNIAALHEMTDQIGSLTSRDEVLSMMGILIRNKYVPGFDLYIYGNRESNILVLFNALFSKYIDYNAMMAAMGYTEEETEKILSLADEFIEKEDVSEDEEEYNPKNYHYWMKPENCLKALSFRNVKARARARTRGNEDPTVIDYIYYYLDTDANLILESQETWDILCEMDDLSYTEEGLEILKAVMQLAIINRDGNFIGIDTEQELKHWLIYNSKDLYYRLSKLYWDENISNEASDYVNNLTEDYRTRFGERIQALDWMTDATKQNALEKLQKVYFVNGTPKQWNEDYMLELSSDNKSLYDALAELEAQYNDLIIHNVAGTCNYDNIFFIMNDYCGPWEANAIYYPSYNCVFLPASNLIAPISDPQLGDAYNLAVIGATTIGHELTHGFDNSGSRYDGDGNIVDWWTPGDVATFVEKQQLMIDHFNAYEVVPGSGVYLDGTWELGENIADLGGLETSLDILKARATKLGFSSEALNEQIRIFLMSYAQGWKNNFKDDNMIQEVLSGDEHAPGKWRVNAQVNNIDEWYNLFNVKPENYLFVEPSQRVHIW